MAAIAGLRGTGDWATDERPKNFREMILWRNPNGSAPLTALLSKMASDKKLSVHFGNAGLHDPGDHLRKRG